MQAIFEWIEVINRTHTHAYAYTHRLQDDPNMTEYLSAVAEDDMEGFKQSYMTAASFISDDTAAGILAHFNNEAFHTPPLSVNVISNALLRYANISNALLRCAVVLTSSARRCSGTVLLSCLLLS